MHQNVKIRKEQHIFLNKVLILTSPILDINVSTEKEMGKILVFKCRYEMKKKSAGVTFMLTKPHYSMLEGFYIKN